MIRPFLVAVFLSGATIVSSSSPNSLGNPAQQERCSQEHREWVADTLQKMKTIKPGMTRNELLEVFETEGSLSDGLRRTYASQDCPYFKVDLEFEAVGRQSYDNEGRVTLVADNRDVASRFRNLTFNTPRWIKRNWPRVSVPTSSGFRGSVLNPKSSSNRTIPLIS